MVAVEQSNPWVQKLLLTDLRGLLDGPKPLIRMNNLKSDVSNADVHGGLRMFTDRDTRNGISVSRDKPTGAVVFARFRC